MVVIIRLKVIIIKKRTVNSTFFYDCSMDSKKFNGFKSIKLFEYFNLLS